MKTAQKATPTKPVKPTAATKDCCMCGRNTGRLRRDGLHYCPACCWKANH